MNLWQRTVLDGSGVNFKLGAVLRPVAGLRLGVAFHTPTYYSLERSYRGDISSQEVPNVADPRTWTDHGDAVPEAQYDEGPNSWNFTSPARLLLGASYTFGQMAVLSVDYERDWYNGMRMKNVPYGSAFSWRTTSRSSRRTSARRTPCASVSKSSPCPSWRCVPAAD